MSTPPRPPGFLPTLFDATFSHLLAQRLVRVLYLLALITIGTIAFVLLFGSVSQGPVAAVIAFIAVPTLALLCIGIVRVVLEAVVVIFRMGEHTQVMAESLYRMSTELRSDRGSG